MAAHALYRLMMWDKLPTIMSNVVFGCHSCGETIALALGDAVGRQDVCARCDSDLHCCRNCRFFDPAKSNQCSEPQAEWVSDKERANFCGYFEPRTKIDLVRKGGGSTDVRKKFDDLFR